MDTKLTLKLNNGVIEQAKKYAKNNNISLSRLIENYLQAVTKDGMKDIKISPLVESLTGVIDLKENKDKQYSEFLSKKYA